MAEPSALAEAHGSVIAEFLRAERDSVVRLFSERSKATVAPDALSVGELVGHVPELLAEASRALAIHGASTVRDFADSSTAEAHGEQRLRVGYDLNALVREYGLLRDCIFERLDAAGLSPPLHELRLLSDWLSAATESSVNRYVGDRRGGADSERRHLLGLFQQAPGFVAFLRGPTLIFELANAAYLQLVGHRDILGKPAREALPEVEGQGYFELLDRVFSTGEPFVGRGMKVELQREPGAPLSEAIVDFLYHPIRDASGLVIGVLAQGHDVTELKRNDLQRHVTEAALRASEERYRTLFESIDDGFCLMQMILDASGETVDYRFLEANAAFEGHTGLHNAVGKTARELVPDLDASWFELYGRVAATGETARFENHAPAMGGRWFDVYASRVGNPELRQVALVFKDVTERKRVEAERERLLARESAARREAEQAGRLKDEFLATVSHELRTPLNSILGWAQMLRGGRLSVETRQRGLDAIERNARAQTQLIEDLLDVSRILAGKLRLEVEAVEVQVIVEAALETARPAADAKQIQLSASVARGSSVMADPYRLQQVVWNLLSNAVKFTPRGGRVQVIVEPRDACIEIIVADSGKGIAKDFQPHVFERFRQAEGGTTRSHGGLGLGLSIVRQLVEMHGGTVSVFSDGEGRGARFTVRLPVTSVGRRSLSEAPAELSTSPQTQLQLVGVHVLLVEDDEDARDMLRTLLEGCGARVSLAASVVEAIERFRQSAPDVLLSDIAMPEQDGYGLLEHVRKLPFEAGGEVPAVALTAYARSEDRSRALLSGFNSHVAKPVKPQELVGVIASLSRRNI